MPRVSRFSASLISDTRRCNFFRSALAAGESEDGDLDELREDIAKRSSYSRSLFVTVQRDGIDYLNETIVP